MNYSYREIANGSMKLRFCHKDPKRDPFTCLADLVG